MRAVLLIEAGDVSPWVPSRAWLDQGELKYASLGDWPQTNDEQAMVS